MDFEKPPQENVVSEKKKSPKEASVEVEIPTESREEPPAYLDFSDNEKAEVIRKITEHFSSQGHDVEEKQIDFPIKQEEIESWVYRYAQQFETKRLAEVALKNSEFAPNLTKEIANRKEYAHLEQILQHYKGTPKFEYCVREIESSLKGEEMQNSILMALSKALTETMEEERVAFENFSIHMLERPEKAARNLATYLKFLGIGDDEAKELLDEKNLLLIGGGIAPIKNELLERGIDCKVTNIEPLLTAEVEGNSDQPIPKNFYDVDTEEVGHHDEIWSANNSLPTYAFNPEQVNIFYQKAIAAIKPGGYLRIVPVSGFSDSITPSMRINRIPTNNASIRNIEILKEHPDLFEIEEFETPPLKSFFGKKKSMKGVNIKVVGSQEEIDAFLKDIANKK